jgi:hypothetical protein
MSIERSLSGSPTPSIAVSDGVMVDENASFTHSIVVPRDGLNAVLPATANEFNDIVQALAALGYAIGPTSGMSPPFLSKFLSLILFGWY